MTKIFKLILASIVFFYLEATAQDVLKAKIGIKWDSENKEYIAEGDVTFENDDVKIFSQYLNAKYEVVDEKEVFNQIEVREDVKIIFNDETYTANYGSYEKSNEMIYLYENVKIISEGRILTGDELVIDIENNTRTMKASKKDSIVEVFINE
tara:strand:- start:7792 stop:8247 length:456 start_codon:yes stop_codon:yes gene_type:complete